MPIKKVTLKDLTPKKTSAPVKGGSLGFGGGRGNDNLTFVRGAKPAKTRDLPPRKDIKGGKKAGGSQDNLTLLRGVKPTKKRDLPPRKEIKGGHKRP